jgi:hypothetical protein
MFSASDRNIDPGIAARLSASNVSKPSADNIDDISSLFDPRCRSV